MLVLLTYFKLNNLFSRFNFAAAIQDLSEGKSAGFLTFLYEFSSLVKFGFKPGVAGW